MNQVSGIILAGGKNTRMGKEKAFLKIGGRMIIEIITAALKPITGEIIIISNKPVLYAGCGFPVVPDVFPAQGPLSGIHAGLLHASNPAALITACDTPFVSTRLARLLIEHSPAFDLVVPRYRGVVEPLFALYNKTCLDFFEMSLKKGHNKIARVIESMILEGIKVKKLEEEELKAAGTNWERVFFNVNTPDDLVRAQKMAGD